MESFDRAERLSVRAWSRGARADIRLLDTRLDLEMVANMTPTGRRATADLIRTLDRAEP